ncbi:putative endodeoxyribonuclease [Erwinia phage phiEaH2]|nr:putative endodeoxyribonuclease [Erwinia phage phiEaH2]AFQ96672.1 putative endodeoxyribonuclease [Erwinia phage phiEaH2]
MLPIYPKPYMPTMPSIVVGADVETQSLRDDAYIIAMGLVGFDIPTMKMVGSFYKTIDPKDPKAMEIFHIDPSTLGWWEGKDNPDYAPTEQARIEAFSGTEKIDQVLWEAKKWLDTISANHEIVITMRGPEFDSPKIMNAFQQCDVPAGKFRKFSILDSDRTTERLAHAFGLVPNHTAEAHHWTRGKDAYEHNAGFDAAKEAYCTARMYHLALVAKTYGFERMLECHNEMCSGEYVAPQLRNQLQA